MNRLPDWIREKKLNLRSLHEVKSLLRQRDLHSVCESLACPNRTECFSRGTATFMILGDVCTRSCGFCRSEEHTSELQSPCNLVCRLLLEKKKKALLLRTYTISNTSSTIYVARHIAGSSRWPSIRSRL